MLEFLQDLFNSDDFMPHGYCFLWFPEILWMRVIADITVAIAYFSIPITIVMVLRKYKDVPFKWVIVMFALFILLCGTTHLINIWVIWEPLYRLEALVKGLTAAVSLATGLMLLPLIPKFIAVAEEMKHREQTDWERDDAEE